MQTPRPTATMPADNTHAAGWLTAREAAARLGVSLATLYSYVSRDLLHPLAARAAGAPAGARGKRYRRSEVERLARRHAAAREPRRVAGAALDFGLPVLESGLCLIEQGRYFYRGQDALQLAETASLEHIAALLWGCELPALAGPALPLARATQQALARLQARGGGMAGRLLAGFHRVVDDSLPTAGEPGHDAAPIAAAWQLVQAMRIAATGGAGGAGGAALAGPPLHEQLRQPWGLPLHEQLRQAWGLPPAAADALRRALVLCADHELNASSFTARCVAGTGATPAAAVAAALAALTGPRHGGMSALVEAQWPLFEQHGTRLPALRRWLDTQPALPGFGHRLYPQGDPRGRALLALLPREARRERLVHAVHERTGRAPNLDFGLVALRRALGAPEGAAMAIFAIGRCVGWLAHVFEQQRSGVLIRPRASYTGPPPGRRPEGAARSQASEPAAAPPAGRVIRRR